MVLVNFLLFGNFCVFRYLIRCCIFDILICCSWLILWKFGKFGCGFVFIRWIEGFFLYVKIVWYVLLESGKFLLIMFICIFGLLFFVLLFVLWLLEYGCLDMVFVFWLVILGWYIILKLYFCNCRVYCLSCLVRFFWFCSYFRVLWFVIILKWLFVK